MGTVVPHSKVCRYETSCRRLFCQTTRTWGWGHCSKGLSNQEATTRGVSVELSCTGLHGRHLWLVRTAKLNCLLVVTVWALVWGSGHHVTVSGASSSLHSYYRRTDRRVECVCMREREHGEGNERNVYYYIYDRYSETRVFILCCFILLFAGGGMRVSGRERERL